MEKFKKYILEELGLDDVDEQALIELHKELGTENIEKLYSKEYRLLCEYDFEEEYGLDSDLLIKYIDCKHWFGIVMYINVEEK